MNSVRAAGIKAKGKMLGLTKLQADLGAGGRGVTAWHGSLDLFYGIGPVN